MNQLEETLGGWVRLLFVAFTGADRDEQGQFYMRPSWENRGLSLLPCLMTLLGLLRIRAFCDDEHHHGLFRILPAKTGVRNLEVNLLQVT